MTLSESGQIYENKMKIELINKKLDGLDDISKQIPVIANNIEWIKKEIEGFPKTYATKDEIWAMRLFMGAIITGMAGILYKLVGG